MLVYRLRFTKFSPFEPELLVDQPVLVRQDLVSFARKQERINLPRRH